MNNNFYEIPMDWYSEFNSTFIPQPSNIPSMNSSLSDPKTALDRGNLFNSLYEPYKNYRYKKLSPTNKKEDMLFRILSYKFAMTDLSLYLDINPMDTNMLNLYNKYLSEEKRLCTEYEREFGPLTLDGVSNINWNWVNMPWPWEGTK